MPRKKVLKGTERTELTYQLFAFVDTNLTEQNYRQLLVDVLGMFKPMGHYPYRQQWGPASQGPTLKDAFEFQKMFREDLASWFDPNVNRYDLPWRADLRRQFQRALFSLVDPVMSSAGRSRFDPRCAAPDPRRPGKECGKRFTPRRRGQKTCGNGCRDRLRRMNKSPQKPPARA